MAIRGDDDINALLNELGTTTTPSITKEPSPSPTSAAKKLDESKDGSHHHSIQQIFTLSPPSNPTVEIIRHRCHEKFKSHVYEAIKSFAPSNEEPLGPSPTQNAKRNHWIRSILAPVWNDMPSHNIWERYQFSLKQLEADCVRNMQKLTDEDLPWCCGGQGQVRGMGQFLNPSVQDIYNWIVQGRSKGLVLEPLLPVSSVCAGDETEINRQYKRKSFELLDKEVQFQFRRSFKRVLNGADKKANSKLKQTWSLDELYSTIKSYHDIEKKNTCDESQDSPKAKKSKRLKDDTNKMDKEEFILNHLFESHPFKKTTQKLHKKLQLLSDDSYSTFLKQLKKASHDHIQKQQQQQAGKKKNRKKVSYPKITFDDDTNSYERQAMVSFGGISLKINEGHLAKLKSLFGAALSRIGCADNDEFSHNFSRSLFTLLLRYDALEGAGLQSAIPPQVFRWLYSKYGCSWECFASPFNCWVESNENGNKFLGGNFGSAFGDTDSSFNSAGTFFDMDFLALARKESGGCFQANPPFASNFIEVMCSRMHQFLDPDNSRVEDNNDSGHGDTGTEENKDIPLMFIIFVPAWKESHGWKALESSPYLTKHVLLLQKEDEHYYAEGTQYRRRVDDGKGREKDGKHGSHRIASFDTSVFFLQNAAAQAKWPLSANDEHQLKMAFAMKSHDNDANHIDSQNLPVKQKKTSQPKIPHQERKVVDVKNHHHTKKTKESKVGPPKKKKTKLLKGGQDEMQILASLGLVDSSSKKRDNQSDNGNNSKRSKISKVV